MIVNALLLLFACDLAIPLPSSVSTAASGVPDCSAGGEMPPARGCVSGTLACGTSVSGTTLGGDSAWDDDFYAKAFCFPSGDKHRGSERVYLLEMPPNMEATIYLTSDCVDLDLVALAWVYEGDCPGAGHPVAECEGDAKRAGGSVRVQSFKSRTYLVGIDGKDGAVGPYTLKVDCRELRVPEPDPIPAKKGRR